MKKLVLVVVMLAAWNAQAQYACQDFKRKLTAAAVPNKDHSALSDTFDIVDKHLELDFTALPSNFIVGTAELTVTKLQATNTFRFELDGYTIDSAFVNQTPVTAGISGDFRTLSLPTWSVGTSATVTIHYSGSGPADPSGWGGWHHNSPYFFNLGVGFGVNPHSYGRSLFPAFDNFVEHSTYSFGLRTRTPYRAVANGQLVSTTMSGDTLHQLWSCSDPIPAYLASVAISDYQDLHSTLQTTNGPIDFHIFARQNDTANARSSFGHMQGIMNSFEQFYGPYIWDKVGYALTTQGAMEHATSVHLPRTLADGTYMGESIIAHEHAHHWWGNLITCYKAEDMWINEGMAEFSAHLYLEEVYDRERYMRTVRGNQAQVLNYAHAQDGGYLALNGVDHGTTYGMTVYNKGAWIGHNLRGYLGDSLYKSTISTIFQTHAHENVSTALFEQWLTQESGVNMSAFFSDWVTTPGHVAVSVDSMNITGNMSNYTAVVGLSQHRRARLNYLQDAPLTLTFYGGGQTYTHDIRLTQPSETFAVSGIPFQPAYVTVNEGEDYLVGSTFEHEGGSGFNIYSMDRAKVRVTVSNSTQPHDIYVEQHWAGPENGSSIARISTGRFWTVRGTWTGDFSAEMRIFYDGRPSSGALDYDLLSTTEDSLVVLWRPDARYDWQLYPHFTKNTMGSATNAFGYVTLTEILPGDYVFANAPDDIGLGENTESDLLRIYPNPSNGEIIIEQYAQASETTPLEIYSVNGHEVYSSDWDLNTGWNQYRLDTTQYAAGAYIVKTKTGEQRIVLTR